MQIACNVIHERVPSIDAAGRSYTMNLTHYMERGTGRIVRTRCHPITPEKHSKRIARQPAPVEVRTTRRRFIRQLFGLR